MIASMTSFGRVEETTDFGYVIWDIRTVNHRYLDINLRLPEEMRMLENGIRQKISDSIRRGKVDCSLRYDPDHGGTGTITINRDRATQVIEAARSLSEPSTAFTTINPVEVMRWPGVIEREQIDLDAIGETLMTLLDKTLAMVVDTRRTEGEKIRQLIDDRCEEVTRIVAGVKEMMPGILDAMRDKLNTRVSELTAELDHDRLEQEVVLLAQKADVAEELDRLEAHIAEVQRTLSAKQPVGRRLDFLMQEMNREANTLGSKSADIKMTNASVELKVLIEQMREQIQNIE
ncbi:MAG: YicC/YloC family endoribonuclease [Gammaproteobacteria bacterium]|nr:YicC/YloC family endoribonuclease [Gammaproteobacteria bacterium]